MTLFLETFVAHMRLFIICCPKQKKHTKYKFVSQQKKANKFAKLDVHQV